MEQVALDPPAGFFRRLWWDWFGKKYALREALELLWPEQDAIILNCPVCNLPCATTRNHKIVSIEPLTIEADRFDRRLRLPRTRRVLRNASGTIELSVKSARAGWARCASEHGWTIFRKRVFYPPSSPSP